MVFDNIQGVLPPQPVQQVDDGYDQGYDQVAEPAYGPTINQDSSFMNKIFSFRREIVLPLRKEWQGYSMNMETGVWEKPPGGLHPLMNEKGISWGISLISSYINPVYIVSNFNKEHMNHIMRGILKPVIANLICKYKEYDFSQLIDGK